MDPNNTQQQTNNMQQFPQQTAVPPVQQPVEPQPVPAATPAPTPIQPSPTIPTAPTIPMSTPNTSQPSQGGSKKGIVLLLLLFLIILGIAGYLLFINNKMNSSKRVETENTSVAMPEPTATPTAAPTSIDQIIVEDPETDISNIEKDLEGL